MDDDYVAEACLSVITAQRLGRPVPFDAMQIASAFAEGLDEMMLS